MRQTTRNVLQYFVLPALLGAVWIAAPFSEATAHFQQHQNGKSVAGERCELATACSCEVARTLVATGEYR